MRTASRGLRAALAGTAMGAMGATAAGAAQDGVFVLELTGTDGVAYTGECVVVQASGTDKLALGGVVPLRQEIHGRSIRCTITQSTAEGSLTVEVRRSEGGNVSRSRTSGKGSTVTIAVG